MLRRGSLETYLLPSVRLSADAHLIDLPMHETPPQGSRYDLQIHAGEAHAAALRHAPLQGLLKSMRSPMDPDRQPRSGAFRRKKSLVPAAGVSVTTDTGIPYIAAGAGQSSIFLPPDPIFPTDPLRTVVPAFLMVVGSDRALPPNPMGSR